MDSSVFLLGVIIFLARIIDVGVGTIRTISIINGRTVTAFFLGIIEIGTWIVIISTVIHKIDDNPLLTVFYVLGFSTGTVVGMYVEKKITLGNIAIRLFSTEKGHMIASQLRDSGLSVTVLNGENENGPVNLLYIVCPRQKMKHVMTIAKTLEPNIFHLSETPGKL